MYMDHMGAESVRTEFMAPQVRYQRNGQPATFWGLAGSAGFGLLLGAVMLLLQALLQPGQEPFDL